MVAFQHVADDVHVFRYPVLDVNCVLVRGTGRALLVDTLSTAGQARKLAAAVRELTPLPVVVVNTHDHFDHWFGNHTIARELGAVDFWAHPSAIEVASDHDGARAAARRACLKLAPRIADEVGDIALLTPNRPVAAEVTIDLGGRSVRLWHPGPAHSAGDVVLFAGKVTIAGDLVEQGAPPSVGSDADAVGWVRVLAELLRRISGPVIPGHGAVVDAAFVERQRQQLVEAR